MSKTHQSVMFGISILALAWGWNAGAKTGGISVPLCEQAPILDGALDDPVWQTAAKIEQLYLFQTNTPVKDTTVYFARDNKIMFFVPIANIQDVRTPIGMDKTRMLCQAYIGLVYGVKGLLYFSLSDVVGEDAWDALQTICAQMRELSPALLNGDIEQNIRYAPDNFNPAEEKFPMVNAAVFKYPGGDYLLLAANIMPHAVDTKFQVTGIKNVIKLFDNERHKESSRKDAKAQSEVPREMFANPSDLSCVAHQSQPGKDWAKTESKDAILAKGGTLELDGDSFTEKIEGYGVRAYKVILADNSEPVQAALENEKAPGVDVPEIVRRVKLGKNHMPNPCFKQQFNRGVPDFYRPWCTDRGITTKGSAWFVDYETLWNGNPSLRMSLDNSDKRWMGAGTVGFWYPPAVGKPVKMTFSFYAKCDKAGDKISIKYCPPQKTFELTTEWKRYILTGDILPGDNSNMGGRDVSFGPTPGSTVWISGLQIEAEETATEFQDDSVLK